MDAKEKKRQYMKQWRLANKERIRSYQNQYRAERPGSRKSESSPEAYIRHRTRILAAGKKYAAANPERALARNRAWLAAHPIEARLRLHNYRLRLKGAKIVKEEISNWFTRICGICDRLVGSDFELDHIIPLSRGGEHTATNLQLAHKHCNRVKHNKLQHELIVVN